MLSWPDNCLAFFADEIQTLLPEIEAFAKLAIISNSRFDVFQRYAYAPCLAVGRPTTDSADCDEALSVGDSIFSIRASEKSVHFGKKEQPCF